MGDALDSTDGIDTTPIDTSRYTAQSIFHHVDCKFPGIKLVHEEPYIFVVEDFLSEDECTDLIALGQKCQQQPSATAPDCCASPLTSHGLWGLKSGWGRRATACSNDRSWAPSSSTTTSPTASAGANDAHGEG